MTPLPCPGGVWNASSAETWARHPENGAQPLNFRTTIRCLLDSSTLPPDISSLTQWALLHGLFSFA